MSKNAALAAALAAPEIDVAEPSRRSLHSFATLVENLEVGEIATRAIAAPRHITIADYNEIVTPMRQMLRNNVAPAVKRAKNAVPGADYTVEVVDQRLAGSVAITAFVTRTR